MANNEIKVTLSKFQEISSFYGKPKYVHDIIELGSFLQCMNAVTLRFGNGSPLEASHELGIPYTEYLKLVNGTTDEITDDSYKKLQSAVNTVFRPWRFGMTLDGIDKAVQVRAHRVFSKEEKVFWQVTCIDLSDHEYIPTFEDVENCFTVDKSYRKVVNAYKALLAYRGIENVEFPYSAKVISVLIDKAEDGLTDYAFAKASKIPYLTLRRYTKGIGKSARYDLLYKIAKASGQPFHILTELCLAAGIQKDAGKTSVVRKESGWYQVEPVDKDALAQLVRTKVSDYEDIADRCGIKKYIARSVFAKGQLHITRPTVKKLAIGLNIPEKELYLAAGYRYGCMKTNKEFAETKAKEAKSNVVVASKKPENKTTSFDVD